MFQKDRWHYPRLYQVVHSGAKWLHRFCVGLSKDVFIWVSVAPLPFHCIIRHLSTLQCHGNQLKLIEASLATLINQLETVRQEKELLKTAPEITYSPTWMILSSHLMVGTPYYNLKGIPPLLVGISLIIKTGKINWYSLVYWKQANKARYGFITISLTYQSYPCRLYFF